MRIGFSDWPLRSCIGVRGGSVTTCMAYLDHTTGQHTCNWYCFRFGLHTADFEPIDFLMGCWTAYCALTAYEVQHIHITQTAGALQTIGSIFVLFVPNVWNGLTPKFEIMFKIRTVLSCLL